MEWSRKVVTRLPLTELWTTAGRVSATRTRHMGEADVAILLRNGPLRFVVANVGMPLQWRLGNECFSFWKSEVKMRLVPGDASSFRLEDFPGEYCYCASEWTGAVGSPIVLLETSH